MKALITGITGQDGSYLAELLLSKGYEVHGIIRRASSFNTGRIEHIRERLNLHYGDVTDASRITSLIADIQPDEVYNLAAQSHVKVSWDEPAYTAQTVAIGALNVLEAVRNVCKRARVYQASSSEMFGNINAIKLITLEDPFRPCSPYAAAKVMAFNLVQVYRKSFGLFAANGVLFNHESPRRGETFVTRKVTRAVGRIKAGLQKELRLGNLGAQRDWGHARDYVEAMWLMLQYKEPRDWTVATGSAMPVSEWVRLSFKRAGLNMDDHVRQDDRYMRPNELHFLCGGYAETKALLGWEPKTSTYDLLNEMVDHDVRLAMAERAYDAAQIANAPILQPLPANNNASASR